MTVESILMILRCSLFTYCVLGLSLAACSSSDQATTEPVEESGDAYERSTELEEDTGAEDEYVETDGYAEDVDQTAQDILNESAGATDDAVETLEGIMKGTTSFDAVGADVPDYEPTFEESGLGQDIGATDASDTIEPDNAEVVADTGMESLKSDNAGLTTSSPSYGQNTVAQNNAAPTIPSGTSAVMYVTASKANLRKGPGTSHAVAGSLVKGDRVFATVEGDWALTSKGVYISASLLSLSPVGRERTPGVWSSQAAE